MADAFDAMTSDRPYRPAISTEEARQEIQRCIGSQFDPAVASAFLNSEISRTPFEVTKSEETKTAVIK